MATIIPILPSTNLADEMNGCRIQQDINFVDFKPQYVALESRALNIMPSSLWTPNNTIFFLFCLSIIYEQIFITLDWKIYWSS